MIILSAVLRNKQAKIASNVHGIAKSSARLALQFAEKLEAQKHVRELERRRIRKRQRLYDEQNRIDWQRDELIQAMENQLKMEHRLGRVFSIRWCVVYIPRQARVHSEVMQS